MVIGVIAMLIDIVLSIVLSVPLLQGGLALATSIATTVEMLALLTLLNGRMRWLDAGLLAKSLGRDIVAAALMALVVWAGVAWVQALTGLGPVVSVLAASLGRYRPGSSELWPLYAIVGLPGRRAGWLNWYFGAMLGRQHQ